MMKDLFNRHGFSGVFASAFCFASGCAHLKVVSQPPDADISVQVANSSVVKSIGKTPFDGDVSELAKTANGGPLTIQIKKQGYLPANILVPNLGGKLLVEARLEKNPFYSIDEVNKIVRLAFLAERQIFQKQYDEALKTADLLFTINENAAIVFQIRGVVKYVRGDFNGSRVDLMRCLELEGQNAEVKALLSTVEQKLGIKNGDSPAGSSGAGAVE
ncbi:hypothetical protein EBR21_01125 [bacterium]|nr:hypothetical protein [bacterium]